MAERNGTPLGVYDLLRYRGRRTDDPQLAEETRREMDRRRERRNAQRSCDATARNFRNDDDAADEDLAIVELRVSQPPLIHVDAADAADILANLDSCSC